MTYCGENVYENMVPMTDPTVEGRIEGFYRDIGWSVLRSEGGFMLSAVPDTGERLVEGIGYWRTERSYRTEWFEDHGDPNEPAILSEYTRGKRFPRTMDLTERPLVLPTDDDLFALIRSGGDLLRRHTYIPRRSHADRWEIRFNDPFLFGVRLTGPKDTK